MNNHDESLNINMTGYRWAVDIVREEFKTGLKQICAERFLNERYDDFKRKDDPVYVTLLNGMNDEGLSRALVSYWTIAQTIAIQSRFWLENAIFKIITHQVKYFGLNVEFVYTQSMLSRGFLEKRVSVREMGEQQIENLNSGKPWRVEEHALALQAIDLLVGQQERERVERLGGKRIRAWEKLFGDVATRDRHHLQEIASATTGTSLSEVTLQCNLLVIEPDKGNKKQHVWAIRFVNPKTISTHAIRKQERINLLRLYAFLVKEKTLRNPESIEVCVAEYVPRKDEYVDWDRYPDYFSRKTYWPSDRLWKFIGVPFKAVTVGLQEAASHFREELTKGLRNLLPNEAE